MILLGFAVIIALFFAANIGASGTAAAMGAAYGGGALKKRTTAVCLVALFAVLGANFGGGKVVATISKGIIPENIMTVEITIIVLLSACLTLFSANRIGVPLSTSEVTVGSIIGVGLAFMQVYFMKLIIIVLAWTVLPFAAFTLSFLFGRFVKPIEKKGMRMFPKLFTRFMTVLLIVAGCYEAFSAGMNNVANAIGPLVGAEIIDPATGILLGSLFLAIGAIAMGGKVLETNGKKITKLSLLQGCIVSTVSGTLVIIASLFGLPVPLTQATTMSIVGVGCERAGMHLFRKPVVRRIITIWIVSPIISMFLSYLLVEAFIFESNLFLSVVCTAAALLLLLLYVRSKKQSRITS